MQFLYPTEQENEISNRLGKSYEKISEMTKNEREFLNALVLRTKPENVLELGVASGSSSIIILNALKEFPKSKLYSIDYSTPLYTDHSLKTGYFVDDYSDILDIKKQWKLYTGGLAIDFMPAISQECLGGGDGWQGLYRFLFN